MTYEWKPGRSYPVAAEEVGKVVERIIKREGVCPPQALVNAARPESSPLRPLFEWDDAKAAEDHRTYQARHVLNSLRVVVIKGNPNPTPPAFLSVRVAPTAAVNADAGDDDDRDGGYVSHRAVQKNEAMRESVVKQEWAVIKGWLARTAWIKEFQPLRDAIPLVEAALSGTDATPQAMAAD